MFMQACRTDVNCLHKRLVSGFSALYTINLLYKYKNFESFSRYQSINIACNLKTHLKLFKKVYNNFAHFKTILKSFLKIKF